MKRLLALAFLVFGAFSAFASGDCRVCSVASDSGSGLATAACVIAEVDQLGSQQCEIYEVQTLHGVVLKCRQSGNACMIIEVYP